MTSSRGVPPKQISRPSKRSPLNPSKFSQVIVRQLWVGKAPATHRLISWRHHRRRMWHVSPHRREGLRSFFRPWQPDSDSSDRCATTAPSGLVARIWAFRGRFSTAATGTHTPPHDHGRPDRRSERPRCGYDNGRRSCSYHVWPTAAAIRGAAKFTGKPPPPPRGPSERHHTATT